MKEIEGLKAIISNLKYNKVIDQIEFSTMDRMLNDIAEQLKKCNLDGVNVRYCWLFKDGELSGILSKSEVKQFSDEKFKEAESLGYKLLELHDFNARTLF